MTVGRFGFKEELTAPDRQLTVQGTHFAVSRSRECHTHRNVYFSEEEPRVLAGALLLSSPGEVLLHEAVPRPISPLAAQQVRAVRLRVLAEQRHRQHVHR